LKLRKDSEDEFLNKISSDDAVFHSRKSIVMEKILYSDTCKLSSLSNTNDPHEYTNKMIGAGGWGWDEEVIKKKRQMFNVLDQLLERNTSFFSCCANVFDGELLKKHGCLKSRMWSQYGENHEGVCLVFSKKLLSAVIQEKYTSDNYFIYEGDVEYKEYVNAYSRHDSVSIGGDTFDDKSPFEVAIDHITKYQKELFFRKQLDYKDEKEYRVIVMYKKEPDSNLDVPAFNVSRCLLGIILGDRFPKTYIPTIVALAGKLDFKYRRLHWASGEYYLLSGN